MNQVSSIHYSARLTRILTWLHFSGAIFVVVLTALFSAVHSPLGREISLGESPGFAWIRANIISCAGFALVYWILVCWLQIRQMRQSILTLRLPPLLVGLELLCIGVLGLLLFFQQLDFVPLVLLVLLISILFQGLLSWWRNGLPENSRESVTFQKPAARAGSFLILLFVFSAAISFLDPSWRRLAEHISLDSNIESQLRYIFPPVLSGVAGMWCGIGMLIIMLGFYRLGHTINQKRTYKRASYFLIFFSLVAVFTAFILITLYYAISWQIINLHLTFTVWQLFIFLCVAGGIMFSTVFYRVVAYIPRSDMRSMIGIVSLTFGATILFPVVRRLTSFRHTKTSWMLLPAFILSACVFIGYVVLFGDMFNPWFTAFSYLKGAVLKIISAVAAGTVIVLIEQVFAFTPAAASHIGRNRVLFAAAAVLGFLP